MEMLLTNDPLLNWLRLVILGVGCIWMLSLGYLVEVIWTDHCARRRAALRRARERVLSRLRRL